MYRVFMLCGAVCLAVSAAVYFRLFTRREGYGSPLDYARKLSGSATLDRKLSDCVIRDITWLKFFCNILLPFMAAVALVFTVLPRGETPISARAVWLCSAILTVTSLLTVKLFNAASFVLLMLSHLSFAVALFFPAPFLGAEIPLWLAAAVTAVLCLNMFYMLRRRGLFFTAKRAEATRKSPAETREDFEERGEDPSKSQDGSMERGERPMVRSKRTMGRIWERRKRYAVLEDPGTKPADVTETFSPETLAPSDRLEWMLSESSGKKEVRHTDVS